MTLRSTPRCLAQGLRGTLQGVLAALCVALPAQADPPALVATRIAMPQQAPLQKTPLPPAARAAEDDVLIMVCRRSIGTSQDTPQDLPVLCLATQVSEQAAQMGPARFRELLDKAASAGAVFVMVLQPQ